MKTKFNQKGSAIVITAAIVGIVSSAVLLSYSITGQSTRLADRGQDLLKVRAAVEGVLDYGYGNWKGKSGQLGRPITQAEANSGMTIPAFDGVTFTQALSIVPADQFGAPVANPTSVPTDLVGFPGWRGRTFNYIASVQAQSTTGLGSPTSYRAKRLFQYVTVQLFQTMYFYENDLEFYRPVTMIVGGLTHTNRYGMISSHNSNGMTLTFNSPVSHVMGLSTAEPYLSTTWSGYQSGANQDPNYSSSITQTNRLEPLGTEAVTVLDPPPAGPLSPSGQLIGPDGNSDTNPNNDSFHELIEPPVVGQPDPAPIATRRIYNKAGIIVTINGATETVTTQNGTSLTASQISTIQGAISASNLYDARELGNSRVNTVNVGTITPVLNAASGFNGVLYIHDITPTTSSVKKNAIRLQNGGTLPNAGLTVASQNAVYIQGDYNTGATTSNAGTAVPSNASGNPNNTDSPTVSGYTRKPAAVIGDAVMLLSNSWNDSNASLSISNRVASHTTYNTAILGGTVPSGYQPGSPAAQYGYGGGANNYPRFLEDWNGKFCTYFGSMVQLFTSTQYTGKWDTGNIYSPPNRCWNYDTNFDTTPPPGAIDAVFLTRGRLSRY